MNVDFNNVGFQHGKLNESELWQVKKEIAEIQKTMSGELWNDKLAGNIKHEFKLSEETTLDLERYLYPYVLNFGETYLNTEINCKMENPTLRLGVTWVNFQKKHEFNPIHNHDGVLSFALWIRIPYNIKNEIELASSKYSNSPVPGHFQFVYASAAGELTMYSIPADETNEGEFVLFPAKMLHCVYPFYTSDEYRISVSGNFYWKDEYVETLGKIARREER